MIFALLCILHDRTHDILISDCRRNTDHIYQSVTFLMLKKYGLDLLGESGYHQNPANIYLLRSSPEPSILTWWHCLPTQDPNISTLEEPRRLSLSHRNTAIYSLGGFVTDAMRDCSDPLKLEESYTDLNLAILAGLVDWDQQAARIAQKIV